MNYKCNNACTLDKQCKMSLRKSLLDWKPVQPLTGYNYTAKIIMFSNTLCNKT